MMNTNTTAPSTCPICGNDLLLPRGGDAPGAPSLHCAGALGCGVTLSAGGPTIGGAVQR